MNKAAISLVRSTTMALGLVLAPLCIPRAQAADVPQLCGIDRQQFSRFAYPADAPYLSDKLMKWRQPPALIVLSPEEGLANVSEQVFRKISEDRLKAGSPIKFIHYASAEEIFNIAEEYGANNVFLIVDAAGFSDDHRNAELRQVVIDALLPQHIADDLFSSALRNQQYSIQSRLNVISGEVYVSVSLINPAIGRDAVSSTLYTMYYAALSPSATYRVHDFFDQMFNPAVSGSIAPLSEFAKAYYRVILDPSVPVGATLEQLGECAR